ncbi:hypothetical protein PAXRUDRAFT_830719 [Paxillus rubicundulus Ve08.2h10]|uniref:Uncharacterized protein n=1 Tax=Paxillus rubicundulus Ve08.2h10 TaxID=930991 RepID=A0A0D0DT26_9AGAM|nr:hypothetical protein PAXRUDRAFT_830719 [Paxillus rubicundulus Ve08.2h10]
MPSLADQIDHLAATAQAIHASASAIAPSEDSPAPLAIPFTRAVLDTSLGDLIRDIDASELGLFTLVPAPDADVRKQPENGTRRGEISRVEFPGATPLRKQPTRRDGMFKPKEYEPEVYAQAALKYLDRYQSIRPMPRARSRVIALIKQLDEARENIKELNETLQKLTSSGPASAPTSQTSSVADEELRINDLQNRLVELRNQKDSLLRSNEPQLTGNPKIASKPLSNPPPVHSPETESHEDAFWSTPAASPRRLRFTDKLLEEEPDFGEVAELSFDSPGPAPPRSVFTNLVPGDNLRDKNLSAQTDDSIFGGVDAQEEDMESDQQDQSLLPESDPLTTEVADEGEPKDEPDEEEKTVVLQKIPPSTAPQGDLPASPPPVNAQLPSTMPLAHAKPPPEPPSKTPKVRMTPELERIVTKIWGTVGDIIMPGNSFSGGTKPPRAKETLVLIQSLAAQLPSCVSPTSSIISSLAPVSASPTPHQVNTAQLLHILLTAPKQAMPLNQLKVAIGGTRALYACVAKKLIRIDRGGGEQVVLFDA